MQYVFLIMVVFIASAFTMALSHLLFRFHRLLVFIPSAGLIVISIIHLANPEAGDTLTYRLLNGLPLILTTLSVLIFAVTAFITFPDEKEL